MLDEIVHEVTVADDVLALPYLRPLYDEPEFVVRNVWRLYGGWWDGDPARLKPPREAGDLRLACQLVEWAATAAGDDPAVHEVRVRVYEQRRKAETSLMAKGIFAGAVRESAPPADDG